MSCSTLFISPGLGRGDADEARARYRADDVEIAKGDHLDAGRIRAVADALAKEHRLRIEESSDPDNVNGLIDLEAADEDDLAPEVGVDAWGVTVWSYDQESASANAALLKRSFAIARSASRLLNGAVYDADNDRIADLDDPATMDAALAVLARPTEKFPEPVAFDSGVGKLALVAFALVAVALLSRFLHGFWLFAALAVVVMAASALLSLLPRRRLRAAPARDESPIVPKPIKPS